MLSIQMEQGNPQRQSAPARADTSSGVGPAIPVNPLWHQLASTIPRSGSSAPILQRKPEPDADEKADNVREAVALLKDISPLSIHRRLSAVPVGPGSTTVETISDTSGRAPVTSIFNLTLQVAPVTGHTLAEFGGGLPVLAADGTTRTWPMTITLGPTAAASPPPTLARDLFHEGMHMQLFIDRAVPSYLRSSHEFGMSAYLSLARNSDSHAPLLAGLTSYIQQHSTTTPKTAQNDAKEIVEKIIEEKYVMDETVRSGLTPRTQLSASDRSASYQSLTTRWLGTYLKKIGVTTVVPDDIGALAGRLRAIWMVIDAEQARRAALPVLVPRREGPPYLPALE
jgi:hypothetical protein